jgi:predicted SprT family Zn-dependent metalloprotease
MMVMKGETNVEILDARRLAAVLMRRHGLTGWQLVFDNAKTRAGICRAVPREIGLSRVLTQLHSEADVTDTILHEIAHALVGPAHGHDAVWRAKALAIGCSAKRCVPSGAPRPAGPWVGTCPEGHETTRHRQPTRVQSCGQCSRVFDPRTVLDWTFKGERVPMHPSYEAERRGIADGFERSRPERPAVPVAARSTKARPAVVDPSNALLPVGSRVRLVGRGKYAGSVGEVVKVGRSRYHVQTSSVQLLTAPFALVEPY